MNSISPQEVQEWVIQLHSQCQAVITPSEKAEQHKYATLISSPKDKVFLSKLLDESSQIRDNHKLALRVKTLIDRYGVPEFFGKGDSFLLHFYKWIGYKFDFVAIPIFKKRLRLETEGVIIHQERPILTRHLADRYSKNIGQNVNLLGEVVLGNQEADARYHHYLEALKEDDINYISIKISGIYAQLHPLNFRESRQELIRRIAEIYRQAIANPYTDDKGVKSAKFVNLDMEEYKDAHLTLDVFKSVLSLPEFKNYKAGIVIQAYLPDAWHLQSELLEFAKERVAAGGAPVKMRLVKGANQQMESVVSSLRGWPNPVRDSKVEVDANYLHILDRALLKENAQVVHVGVASHNLYSIAYAHLLANKNGVEDFVTFEMLEGMANQLWRAMSTLGKQVILYTPVVKDENFLNAISYLVRRLDENTGPENFLSYSFNLEPGTKEWDFLLNQFQQAYALKDDVKAVPTRTQNRAAEPPHNTPMDYGFANEADTDFDLMANKLWAEQIVGKWKKPIGNTPDVIPTQVGREDIVNGDQYLYTDRCQLPEQVGVYSMSKATDEQIDKVLEIAGDDPAAWRNRSSLDRYKILLKVSDLLADRRGDLIGCMCAVTGKSITEGDVEVSEAIDFCRFYPYSYHLLEKMDGVKLSPKGTVLVISPWNFPLAIPVGGVASALAGGNTVILKPATVAAPLAWEFAQAFWDAGVPREALQVIITATRDGLTKLTTSPIVKHIVLTGGTETAQKIALGNPTTPLSAETGGKNALILTASGDRDKAIMNAVASAFGNAGQKCSACSLLLVERGVYNDPDFKRKLQDATTSLAVGSIWELGNVVGPMIENTNAKLQRAIDVLEGDEEWAVAPRYLDKSKYMLAPTVKWGVAPESFTFRNELFAPLLAVCCIDSLEDGVELVNALDYGLTSGLASLDESEQEYWVDNLEAGNLYINRGTTGAIVNRQPFGGMKLSAFGGGIKAGGVNYVSCFINVQESDVEDRMAFAKVSYKKAWDEEFSKPRDVNDLYGEQNIFRYLAIDKMVLRVEACDSVQDVELVAMAANLCQTNLTISIDQNDAKYDKVTGLGCRVAGQSMASFLETISDYDRIRVLSHNAPREIFERAAAENMYVACNPPLSQGRLELLNYLKEQSIAFEYHRYGSITEKPKL